MHIVPLSNRKRSRRGSALLICTLAITVLSMASIAILRANQRGIVNVDGTRASRQARHAADGMVHRAIAAIRLNPTINGPLPLPRSSMPSSLASGARVELNAISGTATQIQVYLYDRAATPARDLIVDPTNL